MKILMLHPHDITSRLEPWTIRVVKIANELVKLGHEVKVVYTERKGVGHREEGILNFSFEPIPLVRHSITLIKKSRIISQLAEWADVIHFQKCFPWISLPSIYASLIKKKPIHYDWDDWEYQIFQYASPSSIVGFMINTIEKNIIKMVDTITVSSLEIKKLCIKRGFPRDRIFDGFVGADIEKFNPKIDGSKIKRQYMIDEPLVMYLGQLSGAQYVEIFLFAIKEVLRHTKDVTFMVIGSGERFAELHKLAADIGISDYLIFTGAIDKVKIPLYIAAADIAVAVFIDNAQQRCKSPLKIAEYMAMGKAIVASNVGEVPYMLGGAGILVEPGSYKSLANGILFLLKNRKLRERLGRYARMRAEEKYNWATTAKNMEKAYYKAIEVKGGKIA